MSVHQMLRDENRRLAAIVDELSKRPGDCVELEAAMMGGAECAMALNLLPSEAALRRLTRTYVNDVLAKAIRK